MAAYRFVYEGECFDGVVCVEKSVLQDNVEKGRAKIPESRIPAKHKGEVGGRADDELLQHGKAGVEVLPGHVPYVFYSPLVKFVQVVVLAYRSREGIRGQAVLEGDAGEVMIQADVGHRVGQSCDGIKIEQGCFVAPRGIVAAVQFHSFIVGAELLVLVLIAEGFTADGVKQPVAVEDEGPVGVPVTVPKRVVGICKVALPLGAADKGPKSKSATKGD